MLALHGWVPMLVATAGGRSWHSYLDIICLASRLRIAHAALAHYRFARDHGQECEYVVGTTEDVTPKETEKFILGLIAAYYVRKKFPWVSHFVAALPPLHKSKFLFSVTTQISNQTPLTHVFLTGISRKLRVVPLPPRVSHGDLHASARYHLNHPLQP